MRSPYETKPPKDQPRHRTGHVFGHDDLTWRGHVLRAGRVKLAEIKPDPVWPGMWRVVTPSGVSDLANLSRARDAALALALAILNKKRAEETPLGGPPVRSIALRGVSP